DFHCVTTWSRMDNRWRGVRFKTIAERAGVKLEARFVLVTAYDLAPGTRTPYTTNLPLESAMSDDVLLVHTWEGEPLPRELDGTVARLDRLLRARVARVQHDPRRGRRAPHVGALADDAHEDLGVGLASRLLRARPVQRLLEASRLLLGEHEGLPHQGS